MSEQTPANTPMLEKVISTIERVGNISGLKPDQDMYTAGFSSIRTLELLLELEEQFAVAIPDDGRFPAARTAQEIHALVEALRS